MLKKNYEFKNVLNKGTRYRGKQIEIFYLKKDIPNNLLGIAIGKKVGNSVTRNRIKRLIRENYRLLEQKITMRECVCNIMEQEARYRRSKFLYYKRGYGKYIS